MTTLNKTLEELTFEFSGIGGILHDAFSSTENSVSTIKNNSNINQRKRRYANISGPNGVEGMTTKFSEAENELLKKSSAQIISAPIVGNPLPPLAPYQNNLPYGVSAAGVCAALRRGRLAVPRRRLPRRSNHRTAGRRSDAAAGCQRGAVYTRAAVAGGRRGACVT